MYENEIHTSHTPDTPGEKVAPNYTELLRALTENTAETPGKKQTVAMKVIVVLLHMRDFLAKPTFSSNVFFPW